MYKILIFGDVCPRWGNSKEFDANSPEAVFHDIIPLMRRADFVTGNLEAPATEQNKPLTKVSMNLKCKPEDLELLKKMGFSALSLANNHILDYGTAGLKDTIDEAEKNGIPVYGAGELREAESPYFYTINDTKIGFLSFAEREFNCAIDYGLGANLWDDLTGIQMIESVKKKCDYLVIQYHGGIEDYEYPSPLLQKRCRAMVRAGANLVTCQHSHCIGTVESWEQGYIIYGQGNSLFGYEKGNPKWNQGLIIQLDLGDKIDIELIPITAKDDGVYLLESKDAEKLLLQLSERSRKLSDKNWLVESWHSFCKVQQDTYLPLQLGWNYIGTKINKITGGRLVNIFLRKKQKRTVMNLIRCEAHREVVVTILEESLR